MINRAGQKNDLDHFHDKIVHVNDDKLTTFILDTFACLFIYLFINVYFECIVLYLQNTTPTANHTAEKQMHVVDACFWPLPQTTTQNDGVETTQEREQSD